MTFVKPNHLTNTTIISCKLISHFKNKIAYHNFISEFTFTFERNHACSALISNQTMQRNVLFVSYFIFVGVRCMCDLLGVFGTYDLALFFKHPAFMLLFYYNVIMLLFYYNFLKDFERQ